MEKLKYPMRTCDINLTPKHFPHEMEQVGRIVERIIDKIKTEKDIVKNEGRY